MYHSKHHSIFALRYDYYSNIVAFGSAECLLKDLWCPSIFGGLKIIIKSSIGLFIRLLVEFVDCVVSCEGVG